MATTPSPFGQFLRAERRAGGFDRPGQLARRLRPDLPPADISRLGHRIARLEQSGHGEAALINAIVAELGVTADRLTAALAAEEAWRAEQEAERRRVWEAETARPIVPHLVLRVMPSVYQRIPVPVEVWAGPAAADGTTAHAVASEVTPEGLSPLVIEAEREADRDAEREAEHEVDRDTDRDARIEAWAAQHLRSLPIPLQAWLVLDGRRRVRFNSAAEVVSRYEATPDNPGVPVTRIGNKSVQFSATGLPLVVIQQPAR